MFYLGTKNNSGTKFPLQKTKNKTMNTQTDPGCGLKAAKWNALVDDIVIPMPGRVVPARVIREQAGIGEDISLVRDHDSPDDEVINDNAEVDIGLGNVFYSERRCDLQERVGKACPAPAKLAFTVNDQPETVIRAEQTTEYLKDLFALGCETELFRDYSSPPEQPLLPLEKVNFVDGPVLIARKAHLLEIIVNKKRFSSIDGVKPKMSGREIASLVSTTPDQTDVYKITGGRQQVPLGTVIDITDCEEFEVIRRNVSGGFNAARVTSDLAKFQAGGGKITLLSNPRAVIYHDVPAHGGAGQSDVLVLVPTGYPGVHLDGAYLPAGSPYLATALGQLQGSLSAAERSWTLKSYHPHTGGGGPAWDPVKHGIHTYYDELLNWLMKA
jgi:hypothetical protein